MLFIPKGCYFATSWDGESLPKERRGDGDGEMRPRSLRGETEVRLFSRSRGEEEKLDGSRSLPLKGIGDPVDEEEVLSERSSR